MNAALTIIVDDDQAVRESLEDLLASAGYETAAFADAEAFLASPQAEAFDCVISDVQLPGMSGLALIAILRARAPNKPVIVVTAHANDERRKRALQAGAACVFGKPFAAEELLECVASNLAGHGGRNAG
jgi:FixJ family two-component response regulator